MTVPKKIAWGLCVALLWHASAFAQAMRPTSGTEENGIRVGSGRMHPYVDLEMQFDDAALVALGTCKGAHPPTAAAVTCPEFVGHARPGLTLDIPANWLDLHASGDADFVWYTGLLTPGDSSNSRIEGAASVTADMNRQGAVEVDVSDTFTRTDRPRDPALGIGVLSLYNEGSISVPIHPGGHALEVTPKAALSVEYFSPIGSIGNADAGVLAPGALNPYNPSSSNYTDLSASLDGRWRFLPKTAVIIETNFDDRNYTTEAGNAEALLFTAQAGLAGLLTSKIVIVAKGGYSFDFGDSTGKNYVGQVEATYLFSELASMKLGVVRSMSPVSHYGTYTDTRPYLEGHWLLGGRLTLHVLSSYDWLSFNEAKGAPNADRVDKVFNVDVGPQYQIAPWFIVAAGYILGIRDSNAPAVAGAPSPSFTRNEVYLRLTFTY